MNLKKCFLLSLALMILSVLSAPRSWAQTQTTGEITGVITDPSGAVVAGAKVTIKDKSKGAAQSTETNKEGVYHFYLLQPSNYAITVQPAGFQVAEDTAMVALGQVATVDIRLALGSTSQTVTVADAAPLLQTENGNSATTFSQQQLSETPNPGNDLTDFVQTAPGVVMNTAGGLGNFADHGVSAASNLFTINGLDDNDPFLGLNNSGATNLLLGANEIQESTIVSNGYSGEFGSLAGANVSYITKSGSNNFHGNAIYYWNGSALNANDWFLNHLGDPKNFSNANQWAGSLGGPIKKDKAFFFFNTEGLRVVIPFSTAVAFPSQAFQNATIANLENKDGFPASSGTVRFYQNIFNLYNNAKGAAKAIPGAGPLSQDPLGCNGFTGLGPGVACSSFFQSANNNLTHEAQYAGRFDYNISDKDRLFLRVLYDQGVQAADTDPISPLFNITSTQPQWQGQLNETHTFNSTLVNQFIVGGQWNSATFDNTNRAGTLAAFPTTIFFGNANIPWFNIGGAAAGGAGDAFFPQGRNVTQYQVSDDLSKTLGNHTLKFGGKFRRYDVSDKDFGVFTSGFVTPNSVAAFFNGGVDPAPNGASTVLEQSFPSALSQPIALYTLAFYGEDDWKIKSNLTLTFSLRIEHQSNPVCQSNCFNRLNQPFLLADNNVNTPYSTDVLQGLNQELQGLSAVLWQPRFGFAWSPRGSHSLVVRGGIGLFNDAFPAVFTDNFASNAPGVNTFFVAGSNIAPGETLNGGNLFAQAAADNAGLLNGFRTNQTLAQIQAAVPGFSPPALSSANRVSRPAQFQKWNLEIERTLGPNSAFSIAYNGNHSIHDLVDRNGVNAFCSPGVGACANVPNFTGLPANPFDPRFGTVSLLDTNGVSNYEGVTFSVHHNITGGWGKGIVQASYTYSHAFDDVSNGGDPNVFFSLTSVTGTINPFNTRQNYGPADYDVRHYFTASYVWELPVRRALFGHGWAPLVDGWQVSGTVFARTGLPYSVTDGGLDGLLSAQGFGGVVLPPFLGGPTSACGEGAATGVTPCVTAAQFVASGSETNFIGGLRNIFRGPGYWNADFTAQKTTKIPHWEKGQFALAFQFFNLFNHPNFALPNGDLTGALGSISSAVSEPTSILGSGLGGDASVRIIQIKSSLTF